MHKITIDNKEIEISDESYNNLKESLIFKEFEWNYPKNKTFCVEQVSIRSNCLGNKHLGIEHGRYRRTVENARKSLLRNKRANRLEVLVEQIQGNLEGTYLIYLNENNKYSYFVGSYSYIGTIHMKQSTAEKICDMLNNGEFSLEVEL